jgi:hypothetical protein
MGGKGDDRFTGKIILLKRLYITMGMVYHQMG